MELTDSGKPTRAPLGALARMKGLFGQRRRFVINAAYQVWVSLRLLGVVLVLLVLLNLSVFESSLANTEAVARIHPGARPYLIAQDRLQVGFTVTASLAFLLGIFFLGMLQSHRTAGAAFNLCRCLRRIGRGELDTAARLRDGDNLQEIASAFNDMTQALRRQKRRQVETLQDLVATADDAPGWVDVRAGLQKLLDESNAGLGGSGQS